MTDSGQKSDLIDATKGNEPATSPSPGFQQVKQAWKDSVGVKIASILVIVIIVLLIIFFILTIVFSSGKSNANSQKEATEKALKICEADKRKTNENIRECNDDKEHKQRQINDLKHDLDNIKKDIDNEKKNLDIIKKDLDECNKANTECKTSMDNLQKQLRECQGTIQNLRNQEAELRNQLALKEAEHTKLAQSLYYYEMAAIGSAILHVAVIIEDIYVHSLWTQCTTQLTNCTNNFLNCNGSLHNCEVECHNMKIRIGLLEQQLVDCKHKTELCKTNLRQCEDEKAKIEQENRDLRRVIQELPGMAVEQAMLHELVKEANYTYISANRYNGSYHGYHKDDFLKAMGTAENSVVIVRTKTGEIFGGFLGIKWQGYGDWNRDPKAFIFNATPPYVGCSINTENAVKFDENLIHFGGEFIVHTSTSKTSVGSYRCESSQGELRDFEVLDMFGFEIELKKKT